VVTRLSQASGERGGGNEKKRKGSKEKDLIKWENVTEESEARQRLRNAKQDKYQSNT